jgi:hypothetical protein
MTAFSPRTCKIVALRMEGLTFPEISNVMGCSSARCWQILRQSKRIKRYVERREEQSSLLYEYKSFYEEVTQ